MWVVDWCSEIIISFLSSIDIFSTVILSVSTVIVSCFVFVVSLCTDFSIFNSQWMTADSSGKNSRSVALTISSSNIMNAEKGSSRDSVESISLGARSSRRNSAEEWELIFSVSSTELFCILFSSDLVGSSIWPSTIIIFSSFGSGFFTTGNVNGSLCWKPVAMSVIPILSSSELS